MKIPISLLALFIATSPAIGQEVATFYKGKTVRLVVGFSSGGGYDVYARLLARHLGRYIPGNPTVIVQNMPGAASLNSVKFLTSNAPTDGSLINTFNPGLITQSITTPEKIGVNFLDYVWIGNTSEDFRVCYTWNGTGIKTWQDFLAAKKVNFGNTGVGTSAYIDNRILSELFGIKLNMVKGYPGSADKRIAIERGELDGDCGSWTSMPFDWLQEGKITVQVRYSKHARPRNAGERAVCTRPPHRSEETADLRSAHRLRRDRPALYRATRRARGSRRGPAQRLRRDHEGPAIPGRRRETAPDRHANDRRRGRLLHQGAPADPSGRDRSGQGNFRRLTPSAISTRPLRRGR